MSSLSQSDLIQPRTPLFWRTTLAFCIGSFMIFANVYVTQPLLPMLAQELAITPLQAGWSFTITTLMLGLSLLVYGPLSDAFGRKWLMVLSMSGAVLATALLSQTRDFETLLWLRAIQGFCLGGLPAIAIAYMGDELSKRALAVAVGLYISGNTLGGIGGRLIGGFFGDLIGWSDVFLVMTLVSFCCLLAFGLLLPASRRFEAQSAHPRRMALDLWGHLCNPKLLVAYLIGGFNFFIFINQYSYITFVLADAPYNLPASLLGMLFLTYLSGTLGSALSGHICHYLPQPVVMMGGIAVLMSGTLLTLVPDIWAIISGFLLNSLGFFMAHSAVSGWVSHTASRARASASSLYLVFYYLGASSGGFYLDPFWHWQGWAGVVVGSLAVLSLTLAAASGLALWQRRQSGGALPAGAG